MSTSKWRYTTRCDGRPCPGDCDLCDYEPEMVYIIMCGGTYRKWETPRHLEKIKGEPVIARTIRLLRECGVEDIYISSNDERFKEYAPLLQHENGYTTDERIIAGHWNDGFYPTDYPVCYIFGDVVFSKEAIEKIVNTETDDIEFFASAPPFSRLYTKPYAEPFALKVVNTDHLKRAIRKTNELEEGGYFKRKPIMWELWQVITDHKLNDIDYNSFTHINDYTCDIDYYGDIERIERVMPE